MPTNISGAAKTADFLTTMDHISAIAGGDAELRLVRDAANNLNESALSISAMVNRYEVPSRDDLERVTEAIKRYEKAVDGSRSFCSRAGVAVDLLTGSLLREPNGDVAPPASASEQAVSEAIV